MLPATPNRGPPLVPIRSGDAEQRPATADDELLRMFDSTARPGPSTTQSIGEPAWYPWDAGRGHMTPPVTPVKLARASLSWGSGSGCSSDSETALWAGIINASTGLTSPATEQRVMQERLAAVPRIARQLVPGWRDCLATDVQPLPGASGCAFRIKSVANGSFFVRLLRPSVSRDSRLVGVTRKAAVAGLTPAVIGADAEAMVQEWIDGSAPDPQGFCEPASARRLGEFIATMHALPDAPTTAESRAVSGSATAGLQHTTSLLHSSVGVSVAFEAPPAPFGSVTQRAWASGCEPTLPLAATLAAASSVGSTLPRAVLGPLQRNGVDGTEFELAWRAAQALQAEQLARAPCAGGAMVWSHGDLHLHNLLQADAPQESGTDNGGGSSERRLYCIDLETVALRPASSDLTNLLRFWRFPALATRRALVEGYLLQQARNEDTAVSVADSSTATAGPAPGAAQPPEGVPRRDLLGRAHLVSEESIDAMLWVIECCMPVCLTRWIVAVMTAPDAMGGDPSSPRVRQAMHFVPLLAPAVAALREAAGSGAEHNRQRIIEHGVWASVGLPPLEQVFCE